MKNTFDCCYTCEKRYIGCHSDCLEYLKAKEETARENKKRYEAMLNKSAEIKPFRKKRGQA